MLYILYGKDDFSRQQMLEGIKKELGDVEMLAVNTILLDGQQIALNQLTDACSTVPFLSPVRLVIVTGLLSRFESKPITPRHTKRSRKGVGSDIGEWKDLANYIKEMPSTTVLVLIDGEVKGKNPLLNLLAPLARVKAFSLLRERELSDWILKRVRLNNGTISNKAINLLIDLVGGDLWTMSSEIDKLLAYNAGRKITEDDVRQLTSCSREANIFTLVDAVIEGKTKLAQQLLHQLLNNGAAASYIMSMIIRQFRLIVRAKDLHRGIPLSEARNRLGISSDYGLEKVLSQSKAYNMERLKTAYHKLLETDIAIKTGKYDGDLALDLLIVELCQN